MLHQKEIVLNAQDTENLLAAVDILRQIVSVIDIQSQYNQLANTLIPSISSYNNNGIEQKVHIEASFPSVTDHNEIELALRNIVNEAS
jgi:carbon monoxide dehydrogenase subunit G